MTRDSGTNVVWVNGTRLAPETAHVSARDRGFSLADGVFETMRGRGGRIFRLDDHLDRLTGALDALRIPVPPLLRAWVVRAAREAGSADVAVRLTVTRGESAGGVAPPTIARPTVAISVSPMPVFPSRLYDEGLSACVAAGRRNERAATAGLKTLAYTDAVAALIAAQAAGADDALFLDTEGHCSDATASNLFLVSQGTLLTPPISCAALPGITRSAVMGLARQQAVPAAERPVGLADLLGAEEAFLTSSLRGVVPLVRVDGHDIGSGRPGALTARIRAAYTALLEQELRA